MLCDNNKLQVNNKAGMHSIWHACAQTKPNITYEVQF